MILIVKVPELKSASEESHCFPVCCPCQKVHQPEYGGDRSTSGPGCHRQVNVRSGPHSRIGHPAGDSVLVYPDDSCPYRACIGIWGLPQQSRLLLHAQRPLLCADEGKVINPFGRRQYSPSSSMYTISMRIQLADSMLLSSSVSCPAITSSSRKMCITTGWKTLSM